MSEQPVAYLHTYPAGEVAMRGLYFPESLPGASHRIEGDSLTPLYTRPTVTTPEAMVEAIARALAKADNIEICSDAQYRHSSYGIRAQAAATVIAEAMAAKDAELAELRARIRGLEKISGYATHSTGCALYQSSYVMKFPDCSCGLDAARAALGSAEG